MTDDSGPGGFNRTSRSSVGHTFAAATDGLPMSRRAYPASIHPKFVSGGLLHWQMTEVIAKHRPVLANRIAELGGETVAFELGDHVGGLLIALTGGDPGARADELSEFEAAASRPDERLLPALGRAWTATGGSCGNRWDDEKCCHRRSLRVQTSVRVTMHDGFEEKPKPLLERNICSSIMSQLCHFGNPLVANKGPVLPCIFAPIDVFMIHSIRYMTRRNVLLHNRAGVARLTRRSMPCRLATR